MIISFLNITNAAFINQLYKDLNITLLNEMVLPEKSLNPAVLY